MLSLPLDAYYWHTRFWHTLGLDLWCLDSLQDEIWDCNLSIFLREVEKQHFLFEESFFLQKKKEQKEF